MLQAQQKVEFLAPLTGILLLKSEWRNVWLGPKALQEFRMTQMCWRRCPLMAIAWWLVTWVRDCVGFWGGQGKVLFLPSFPTGLVTGSVPSRGLSQTSGTITMLILRPFITLTHTPRHISFSAVYSEVSLTPPFCYIALALASSCLHWHIHWVWFNDIAIKHEVTCFCCLTCLEDFLFRYFILLSVERLMI